MKPPNIFDFGTAANIVYNEHVLSILFMRGCSCSGRYFGQKDTFENEKHVQFYWNFGVTGARNARNQFVLRQLVALLFVGYSVSKQTHTK